MGILHKKEPSCSIALGLMGCDDVLSWNVYIEETATSAQMNMRSMT
jgi:hypothetical protein